MNALLFLGLVVAFSLLLLILATIYFIVSVGRKNYEIADNVSVETQIRVSRYNMYVASLQAQHESKLANKQKRKERESNIFPINKQDDDKDPK